MEDYADIGLNLQNILAATSLPPLNVPMDSPCSSMTASGSKTSPSSSSPASAGAVDNLANLLLDKAIRAQGQKILTENQHAVGNIDLSLFDPSSPSEPKKKRKRTKRNPVWNFFNTDEEHVAYCQRCDYSTKSAFSTNLKIHLRCHHNETFQVVQEMERQIYENQLSQNLIKAKPETPKPKASTPDENENAEENNISGFSQQLLSLFNTPDSKNTSMTDGEGSKRKRNRKHPVWKYFGDVSDKVVGCNMCEFRTNSAFSTNLKMHLKSHHKEEFIDVMDQEIELLKREGDQPQEQEGKRRRRTVAELEGIVERCRMSMQKEKAKNSSQTPALAAALSSPSRNLLFSQMDMFRDPSMPQLNNVQPVNTNNDVEDIPNLSPEAEPVNLKNAYENIPQGLNPTLDFVLKNMIKNAALNGLVQSMGSDEILKNKAFRDFVNILDPNFDLPTTLPTS
ncbi:unnamed protein product [Bursaphelenchus xylophilus]|uniref:(pine wood nematode) hypothetical protein n=1 Tax=Bursaphelenchus xylophilus TaxID=6326 RepID=A0A1I7SR47_BURXY|nr:unnamed protein product [Bursaphelenchus xylophilus]CAG9110823.1 unnamed protein product [Bursaphelenchus xylophilus]